MLFKKKSRFKTGDIVYHSTTFEKGKILRQDPIDQKKWTIEWKASISTHPEDELMTHDEYIAAEIERKTKI